MSFARNIAFLGLLSLTGCSNTASVTSETIKYAFWGADDITVTATQVAQLPYASAYLKIGDNPRVFVVLAYVNGDELSWLTADRVMIVTRHGRIIKTVGMENDLVLSKSGSADPLSVAATSTASWQAMTEWEHGYLSGYQLDGTLVRSGQEELDLVTRRVVADRFEETVTMTPDMDSWTNQFWRDPLTGQVVKTRQQLGPGLPVVELTILKPFA
ncbi:YjbF family lipoprotein [Aeromonas enteropelogenes]|uniref:YjbF family lipoprotein n=1 Tax=Aeromonas enteropelogenes TaxID=29489 RepID=UPI003BA173DD